MLNFFYRAFNNKKGFTLIEVLVVVAIIGILAALAAPRIIGRINDANISHDVALAKTLTTAVEQYIIDSGDTAPTAWKDLVAYLDTATYNLVADPDTTFAVGIVITGKAGGEVKSREVSPGGNDTYIFEAFDSDGVPLQ